jgi:hypothetical protein
METEKTTHLATSFLDQKMKLATIPRTLANINKPGNAATTLSAFRIKKLIVEKIVDSPEAIQLTPSTDVEILLKGLWP